MFFTGTVLLALVNRSPDWEALVGDLGPWVTVHGAATVGAGVLPRWTGVLLIVGVVLVALASPLPGAAQTLCAGVRDLAFAGMGLSLLTRPQLTRTANERSVVHVHA